MKIPSSENYTVAMNGQPVDVFHTAKGDFAILNFTGNAEIDVRTKEYFDQVSVRPIRARYDFDNTDDQVTLTLPAFARVSIEPYELENPLFLLCAEYIEKPANATHVFPRGSFTDIGILHLKTGDCVYIEQGAVVMGSIEADKADNITITGNGIMWNLPNVRTGNHQRAILLKECNNVKISGITLADQPCWNVVPTACNGVEIRDVNVLGVVMSTDAFDIVGSQNVTISRCFACVNDDCVAIKASYHNNSPGGRSVKNVRVSDCVFWKQPCGNALEIGYETSCHEMCDIVFENIDIIHAEREGWQSGAVFSIHNGDRAHVHDVLFKNIHIEDAREKLIDIKILSSKYSSDKWRGNVNDITFDGIYVLGTVLPPSIIRGYEPDGKGEEPHIIRNIFVRNLYLEYEQITGQQDAHAIVEIASNVVFE